MNIALVLKEVELSPMAEEHLTSRVEKLVNRVHSELPVHVVLEAQRNAFSAQVRLTAPGREMVGVGAAEDSVLTAFDSALARVERQMNRHFDKLARKDRGLRPGVAHARAERVFSPF